MVNLEVALKHHDCRKIRQNSNNSDKKEGSLKPAIIKTPTNKGHKYYMHKTRKPTVLKDRRSETGIQMSVKITSRLLT